MSRRPEPLWPATSEVEWDAKGPRAVSALIALLSSTFVVEYPVWLESGLVA
jgi:hypothetical protein